MLFSQRQGLSPIKSLIQVDSVDVELRNALWNAITVWRNNEMRIAGQQDYLNSAKAFWVDFFKLPLDRLPDTNSVFEKIRTLFLEGDWFRCYDILQFLVGTLSSDSRKSELIEACNVALEAELSGYRFIGEQITPITSEAEVSSIEDALANTDSLRPVNEHLTTALAYLSNRQSPDYRNSIKESISAVESLCNLITGDKNTLGDALKRIETKVKIHPALNKGFSCIYGYTNDASGIRHALLDEPNIDFDDAKFMLVSCSAFITYLISKSAKAGISLGNFDSPQ